MEILANKFTVIYTSMKKKPYDLLDQRKTDYDIDYQDFKRSIGELQVNFNTFFRDVSNMLICFNTGVLYSTEKLPTKIQWNCYCLWLVPQDVLLSRQTLATNIFATGKWWHFIRVCCFQIHLNSWQAPGLECHLWEGKAISSCKGHFQWKITVIRKLLKGHQG